MIGIGLIGCGGVAQSVHIPNLMKLQYQRRPIVELRGVVDVIKEQAEMVGQATGTRAYPTVGAMLDDPAIDAVMILTPETFHASLAIQAAMAGRHVFMEKPIATSPSAGEEVAQRCADQSVKLMVGYMMRFDSDCNKTRELLSQGLIGQPLTCNSIYIWPIDVADYYGLIFKADSDDELAEAEEERPNVPDDEIPPGLVRDTCSHYINLLRYWFGEVKSVWADIDEHRPFIVMRFESGLLATHQISGVGEGTREHLITGTEGYIRTRLGYPHIPLDFGKTSFFSTRYRELREPVFPRVNMYEAELEHFVQCILEDQEPRSSGIDAAKDLQVMRAVYEAAADRREVEVWSKES